MDEKVAKWIIEFLLRKPIDQKIINGVLSCLPLSNSDNRLKKTILLRKIELETSSGSVSEKLLELFEIIEELDHREGKTAPDSMKNAYCAIAVDCTLRFLEENVEENGKYFEAVERVWRNRVCAMEGLVSEESNRWLGDIEAAIYDPEVCGKLLMRNTRNEALKAVRGYSKEAWESMGPAFLEVVATKVGDEVEELRHGSGGTAVAGSDLGASQGTQRVQTVVRRKHVAVKTKRPRGAKISDAADEEDAEDSINTAANDVSIHKMDKVQELPQSDTNQLHAAAGDSHPENSSQGAHNLSKDNDVPTHKMDNHKMHNLQALQSDSHSDTSRAAHAHSNDLDGVENRNGPVLHASPEVIRVQEALKTSAKELCGAVTDPLPEALQIAETCVENQTEAGTHVTPEVERVPQALEPSSVELHASRRVENEPKQSTENNPKNVEIKGSHKHTGEVEGSDTHDPQELLVKRKRSLMEPNGTSHTFEWDESTEDRSRGLRVSLPPSVKRSKVSPLELYEEKKLAVRRERRKWTPQEEDTLRDAVKRFGRRWKFIQECFRDIFKDRTDIDLKDKWRNMLRSQP